MFVEYICLLIISTYIHSEPDSLPQRLKGTFLVDINKYRKSLVHCRYSIVYWVLWGPSSKGEDFKDIQVVENVGSDLSGYSL